MGRGQLQDRSLSKRAGMGHTIQQKEQAMIRSWQGGQWGDSEWYFHCARRKEGVFWAQVHRHW